VRQARLALALIALAAPALAADPLLTALDACRGRLDRELDVGYARIAARCPDLARQLAADDAARWLPQGWQDANNDLSAGSLEELRTLIARERAVRAQRPAPSVQRLHEVFAELGERAQQRSGLWARFSAWLRQVLAPEADPGEPGFLGHLLNRIGMRERVVEFIAYAALALVVALAVFVGWQELRAAGAARRRVRASSGGPCSRGLGAERVTLAYVERAALEQRPRLLLALVLDELTRHERLPPPGALTTRELLRAAELAEPVDHERLGALAAVAEDLRFAAAPVPASRLQAGLAAGRALLERLARGGARGAERSPA